MVGGGRELVAGVGEGTVSCPVSEVPRPSRRSRFFFPFFEGSAVGEESAAAAAAAAVAAAAADITSGVYSSE
jgi:hypothetical protein